MLIEVNSRSFKHFFPVDPHPFISESFIELNKNKAEAIVRLTEDSDKKELGLIAGIKNDFILSPFSAPFGGFHFRKENVYIKKVDQFVTQLKEYIHLKNLKGIEITLPPEIYNYTINAKLINSFIRNGFSMKIPDITNWVVLDRFNGKFSERNSREYYRQALRNGLKIKEAHDIKEKEFVYDLIRNNRQQFGRPIFMSFQDILDTSHLWPTDFFMVKDPDNNLVASAIFYRNEPEVAYAVFWGDNLQGRPLRAMDFMAFEIFRHYKTAGFKYIDLGISTEQGDPNEGLLRFKESHESTSSLRYSFTWKKN